MVTILPCLSAAFHRHADWHHPLDSQRLPGRHQDMQQRNCLNPTGRLVLHLIHTGSLDIYICYIHLLSFIIFYCHLQQHLMDWIMISQRNKWIGWESRNHLDAVIRIPIFSAEVLAKVTSCSSVRLADLNTKTEYLATAESGTVCIG